MPTKKTIEELNRCSIEEFKSQDKTPLIVVLDNIRSLHNVGSIFRTADAFSIEAIYLCGITGTPPHKEMHKTAIGATDSVEWKYFKETKDAIIELRNKSYTILSLEQAHNSVKLNNYKTEQNKSHALVLGNEVYGVQQEIIDLSDFCVEIPQFGTKHSLNVSISGGIAIWEIIKKFKKL